MKYYRKKAVIGYMGPAGVMILAGILFALLSALCKLISLIDGSKVYLFSSSMVNLAFWAGKAGAITFYISLVLAALAFAWAIAEPDASRICRAVKAALFIPERGNPLNLKDGELLPVVRCKPCGEGRYRITVSAGTCPIEAIEKLASPISSALQGKFENYAVTQRESDLAFNQVTFTVEDVMIDRSITAQSAKDLCLRDMTKLKVQVGVNIDLTTSGSMLLCGKTRSGKTTGAISLILQILAQGSDGHGSGVTIIDPKRAELSMCNRHVVTLDEDGEARAILNEMKAFAEAMRVRQNYLNVCSQKNGDAVHWWEVGFKPAILFLDEYVALRSIFPKKAAKDDDYCLATFDGLIKRIVTMGASAGSYVLISIAEASVEEGGLPSMLRSAMSTKILFRPTLPEARLLWDSEKLAELNTSRTYLQGDAWFSSTDGEHDLVTYVHFPRLTFPAYRELGRLLDEFYV